MHGPFSKILGAGPPTSPPPRIDALLKCTKYCFGSLGEITVYCLPRTIGRGRPTSKGMGGSEGKRRKDRIEEGKGRKGREKYVAFHRLLLSNLTTALLRRNP